MSEQEYGVDVAKEGEVKEVEYVGIPTGEEAIEDALNGIPVAAETPSTDKEDGGNTSPAVSFGRQLGAEVTIAEEGKMVLEAVVDGSTEMDISATRTSATVGLAVTGGSEMWEARD